MSWQGITAEDVVSGEDCGSISGDTKPQLMWDRDLDFHEFPSTWVFATATGSGSWTAADTKELYVPSWVTTTMELHMNCVCHVASGTGSVRLDLEAGAVVTGSTAVTATSPTITEVVVTMTNDYSDSVITVLLEFNSAASMTVSGERLAMNFWWEGS